MRLFLILGGRFTLASSANGASSIKIFCYAYRSKSHQNDRLASLEVKASAKGRNSGTDALTRTESFK